MAFAPEDAHYAAEKAAGLPQLDYGYWPGVIFWTLLAFGLLYFLLSRGALKTLGGAIEDRRDKIADDLDRAAALTREASEAEVTFQKSLADARARAHAMATQSRDDLAKDIAADSAAVEAELAKRAAAAEERIAEATGSAMASVNAVATDAAAAMIEKLTGASVDRTAVERAVAAGETR